MTDLTQPHHEAAPTAADATTPAPTTAKTKSNRAAKTKPRAPPPAEVARSATPKGKLGVMVALLQDAGGATVEAMAAATGWQNHSVRGAMSGALKKKLGLNIVSEKLDGARIYRIVEGAPA